ncbi:MAG: YitT family protein [Bacteroidales bacterium]|nr:YitT family protein [Bacteroidales bacterium]MBQ1753634.1 YitT family protein [Bacteroidales bacterium]MBQ2149669.1 YitT family protein [Bacteroidales bacterium]MBQ3743193.1 YitT family protein [Bacteroidales bacterium]MBQ5435280.1 YitT family protein [Bacteroidales bacterium]
MDRNKVFATLKSYAIITVGLILYTLAWVVFIIPHQLVGGGVTGISAVIQYCTGFHVSYSFFIINAILLLIALKVLGPAFGVKTVYAMVVTTLLLRFLPMIIPQEFIQIIALDNGKLLSVIIGGMLSALGISLTFSQGGSSGGTDIVALMITKYRAISPGKILLILDIFIIGSSLIVPTEGSWGVRVANLVYGYVMAGVFSVALDLFVSGSKQSVQIFIFSKNFEKIADRITTDVHRGVTALDGKGWYTKTESTVLVVVARKQELKFLLNLIKEEDPQAFISVASVTGVYGSGFEVIKK